MDAMPKGTIDELIAFYEKEIHKQSKRPVLDENNATDYDIAAQEFEQEFDEQQHKDDIHRKNHIYSQRLVIKKKAQLLNCIDVVNLSLQNANLDSAINIIEREEERAKCRMAKKLYFISGIILGAIIIRIIF